MTPGKYNMICPQGATFSKTLIWKIDDVPVNLTGYTARMQAKDKPKSTCTPVIDISTESGEISLGGEDGTIEIVIGASETSSIYAKEYVYDLLLYIDEDVYRVIEGKFIVTPEVTS
jgi:hypothetical protein